MVLFPNNKKLSPFRKNFFSYGKIPGYQYYLLENNLPQTNRLKQFVRISRPHNNETGKITTQAFAFAKRQSSCLCNLKERVNMS